MNRARIVPGSTARPTLLWEHFFKCADEQFHCSSRYDAYDADEQSAKVLDLLEVEHEEHGQYQRHHGDPVSYVVNQANPPHVGLKNKHTWTVFGVFVSYSLLILSHNSQELFI